MMAGENPQFPSIEALIETLNGEEDIRCLRGLGSLASSLSAFVTDEHFARRAEAAERLGATGDRRALLPLLEALRDYDASVRQAAARALAQLGDRKAVKALVGLLHDEDAGVRRQAAESLGGLGDRRALKALEPLLFDGEPAVVQTVQAVLATLGRP